MLITKYASLLLLGFPLVTHATLLCNDHRTPSFRDHRRHAHHHNANHHNEHHLKTRCNTTGKKLNNSTNSSLLGSPPAKGASVRNNNIASIAGVLNVQSECGNIGATRLVTEVSGPNGNEHWLNCGINDGGWRPPHVKIDDLITEELSDAITTSSSPFQACKPFVQLFDKYGLANGIPSILLAAIALQESSCKPHATGGAGEQGLMQITKDKCNGAPGGNCKDPDYNIRTGAKFFADTLASNGGNVIETIGMYNGWKRGLTYVEATAAASGPCCRCQNNLDYIHQTVNGWLQNKNVYDNIPRIGVYFNLDKCRD